jgi:hypothetical protein
MKLSVAQLAELMIKLYVYWEMEWMQKEIVVGQYGVLSQHVHEDTEKSSEELV